MDLKPCPFCGSSATVRTFLGSAERVVCEVCGTIGPTGDSLFHHTRVPYARADEGWNRRHVPPALPKARRRFRADTKHAATGESSA